MWHAIWACAKRHCNTLQRTATRVRSRMWCKQCDGQYGHVQKHTATHCNTLQHTATRCNTLQHTATRCNTLQHAATHCNTLQYAPTRCNTLQHAATHCNTLQHVYALERDAYNASAIWAVKKGHSSFQPAFLVPCICICVGHSSFQMRRTQFISTSISQPNTNKGGALHVHMHTSYTNTYVLIHTRWHIHTHTHIHIHAMYTHIRIYIYMPCTHTYAYTYTCHVHTHTHIHIHAMYIHIRIYIRMYIHIRIYKYPDEEGVGENIGYACAQHTSLWMRNNSIILRFKELVELRAEISGKLGFQNIYDLKQRRSVGWLWLVGSIEL